MGMGYVGPETFSKAGHPAKNAQREQACQQISDGGCAAATTPLDMYYHFSLCVVL
jgi:hypothetical protein